jgi:hypothetical protein
MTLKSTIEVDMPCLTAEMIKRHSNTSAPVSSDDSSLLEGQISLWTIRLRNVGNAPATSVTLKTNLPWINIKSNRSKSLLVEELEAQATSGCLGPTGTLVTVPIEGSQLQESGCIHPRESVDIPVEIRTSGHGKQQFYMLYRYELKDPSTSRHRWLRKMYEVPVSSRWSTAVFLSTFVQLLMFSPFSALIGLPFFGFICQNWNLVVGRIRAASFGRGRFLERTTV